MAPANGTMISGLNIQSFGQKGLGWPAELRNRQMSNKPMPAPASILLLNVPLFVGIALFVCDIVK
jgi:hypothetical protein